MKEAKKLSLKRERLTELSTDQLQGIAGGLAVADAAIYIRTGYTFTCGCTGGCPTAIRCVTVNTCTCGCTDFQTLCCRLVEING